MHGADFIPISVATLLPTETVGLDLYQQEVDSERLVLYRDAEFPLTMDDLERLRGRGVHRLFISKTSRTLYQKYLRKIATADNPGSIPLSARAGALNEVAHIHSYHPPLPLPFLPPTPPCPPPLLTCLTLHTLSLRGSGPISASTT